MGHPLATHMLLVRPRIVRTLCGERVEALYNGTLASVVGRDAKLNVTDDARKITCAECQRRMFIHKETTMATAKKVKLLPRGKARTWTKSGKHKGRWAKLSKAQKSKLRAYKKSKAGKEKQNAAWRRWYDRNKAKKAKWSKRWQKDRAAKAAARSAQASKAAKARHKKARQDG